MSITLHKSANILGHNVFYREAGLPTSPTIVLLHASYRQIYRQDNVALGAIDVDRSRKSRMLLHAFVVRRHTRHCGARVSAKSGNRTWPSAKFVFRHLCAL